MNQFDEKKIQTLLDRLAENGATATDKTKIALFHSLNDARVTGSKRVNDRSLLAGAISACGALSGFLQNSGIDIQELIDSNRLANRREHLLRNSESKESKPKHRSRARTDDYFGKFGQLYNRRLLDDLLGTVTTEDLALRALQTPGAWSELHSRGLSINNIKAHCRANNSLEPDIESQKFILGVNENKLSFDVYEFESGAKIEATGHEISLLLPVRVALPLTRDHILGDKVDEFEWLINKPNITEYEIQVFLEQNPRFLLGIEYKELHSQIALVRSDRSNLRPDFFLERLDANFCDILDIKLPKERLVVGSPNRRTFSAAVSSAIGQLREYKNFFDDSSYRKWFHSKYGLHAYKPRIQVVIGRSADFLDSYERFAMQEELTSLEILTFDDIIARMRHASQIANWTSYRLN